MNNNNIEDSSDISIQLKKNLSDQIYQILRNDIINQVISGGEKLTLKALQQKFGVSSTPIREAISRLNQEMLVTHVNNVGASVVQLDENDIREIYDMSGFLDSAALELAMKNSAKEQLIKNLEESIEKQQIALENKDISKFMFHSDDFHNIFYKYANNSRLWMAAQNIRSQFSILATQYQNLVIGREIVMSEHIKILDVIKTGDCEKSKQMLRLHFEHSKNYLLDNLTLNR